MKSMELLFDRKRNREERINFIRYYAGWIRSVPNSVWSKQQAVVIDSFIDSSKNFRMSPERYIEMMNRREKNRKRPDLDRRG